MEEIFRLGLFEKINCGDFFAEAKICRGIISFLEGMKKLKKDLKEEENSNYTDYDNEKCTMLDIILNENADLNIINASKFFSIKAEHNLKKITCHLDLLKESLCDVLGSYIEKERGEKKKELLKLIDDIYKDKISVKKEEDQDLEAINNNFIEFNKKYNIYNGFFVETSKKYKKDEKHEKDIPEHSLDDYIPSRVGSGERNYNIKEKVKKRLKEKLKRNIYLTYFLKSGERFIKKNLQ